MCQAGYPSCKTLKEAKPMDAVIRYLWNLAGAFVLILVFLVVVDLSIEHPQIAVILGGICFLVGVILLRVVPAVRDYQTDDFAHAGDDIEPTYSGLGPDPNYYRKVTLEEGWK